MRALVIWWRARRQRRALARTRRAEAEMALAKAEECTMQGRALYAAQQREIDPAAKHRQYCAALGLFERAAAWQARAGGDHELAAAYDQEADTWATRAKQRVPTMMEAGDA